MSGLHIKSDFIDYYDVLSDTSSKLSYNRFLQQCSQRGTALKYLRSIGIKTLEVKQVSQYLSDDGPIVVYTDPKGHNGKGKKVMSVDEAISCYSNCVASKYIDTPDRLSIKFLQIGKRRFTLCFRYEEPFSLCNGTLIDIKESSSEYNRLIGIPIFSIDYISNGFEMVATDFNQVQNLVNIGIDSYLSETDIIEEIMQSLIVYNKL